MDSGAGLGAVTTETTPLEEEGFLTSLKTKKTASILSPIGGPQSVLTCRWFDSTKRH